LKQENRRGPQKNKREITRECKRRKTEQETKINQSMIEALPTPQEGCYTEEPQLRYAQRLNSQAEHLPPLQLLLGGLSRLNVAAMNLNSSSSSSSNKFVEH
jgi:hypothetical protein